MLAKTNPALQVVRLLLAVKKVSEGGPYPSNGSGASNQDGGKRRDGGKEQSRPHNAHARKDRLAYSNVSLFCLDLLRQFRNQPSLFFPNVQQVAICVF